MFKNPTSKSCSRRGFTLIELVVVIAILGILAGIAIPRFMDSQASAKGAKIVADLRTIDSAATMYYAQKGKYPDAISSSNNANSTDDFIGNYLAAWPKPDTGTFIVALLKGGTKTYEGITDTDYTLTAEGRANYNGHPVEWYLGGGESFTDNNLVSAINEISTYLSQSNLSWSDKCGSTLNSKITYATVDSSLMEAAGYTGTMYWHTDTGTPYYFANYNYGTNGNQWTANIVEVNGTVYALKSNTSNGSISNLGSGTTAADKMQSGLEIMVANGTAKKLGTIATK